MKKLLIFFLFAGVNIYSQTKPLFIIYDNKAKVESVNSKNDSVTVTIYKFDLNEQKTNHLKLILKDGILQKDISIAGTSGNNYLKFKHISNRENKPLLIPSKDIINSLTYSEILNSDLKNVRDIISTFTDLYIIKLEDSFDGYYVARKVSLEPITTRL